jgi:O-methyltransferase
VKNEFIGERVKTLLKNHYPPVGKKAPVVFTPQMMHIQRKRADYIYHAWDYVRVSQLELLANEIYENNVGGSVAELGVYRGDFAKFINKAFPDRKLYLFDTFEGFAETDAESDRKNRFSSGDQDFSDTSISLVLSKMDHPENCIVKKGYFPDTAVDLDTPFCFVSLDCDLYEPMYAGLSYFYPYISTGGGIFIHDYNSGYKGARMAVTKYCNENHIPYIPLCDSSGSVMIRKPF